MDPILERYQALEDKVASYTPNLDTKRLYEAFTYADTEHHGQLRKSGEPYIIHPLAVADIVADLGLDVDSVIAALLHDCIEDTGATHEEIAKKFGTSVADLVEGVTKLTRVQYVSKEEEQMENLRKMLMAMAHDIRVILIKICDRLHNMRTMEYQSPKKQREKSLETMEIYAPLAHRLGMQKLKWELEDLSLRYLDPVGYKEIEDEMAKRSAAHEEFLASIQLRIQQRMEQEGIRCKVYGRVKHTYSIYRKMFTQNKTLDEIFDLYAFRVIVDDIPECYNVLGCIHDMFKPVLAALRTISAPQSPICTSPSTPPSSAGRASPLRCRSAPGRCTRRRSTALPPTGSTSRGWPTRSWAAKGTSSGSASCWRASRTPTRRSSSAP